MDLYIRYGKILSRWKRVAIMILLEDVITLSHLQVRVFGMSCYQVTCDSNCFYVHRRLLKADLGEFCDDKRLHIYFLK